MPSHARTRLPRLGPALAALLFLGLGASLAGRAGLNDNEICHAIAALDLLSPMPEADVRGRMPLMRTSYNGALKSYLHYVPFRLFGSGLFSVRAVNLASGAAAVLFLSLLACRLYGAVPGALFGAVLACDPALLIVCAFDSGPASLQMLLKSLGLFFLASWVLAPRGAFLFAAGLAFGLGVWDKPNFLWLLFALPLFLPLLPPEKRRALLSRSALKAVLGGLFLGALPFILFNALHPLESFMGREAAGWSWGAHLADLPRWTALRWKLLLTTVSGERLFSIVSGGVPPGFMGKILPAATLAALVLLLWARPEERRRALGHCLGWTGLAALVFLSACLTPYDVKEHHLYMTYPFPQLALLALLSAGSRAPSARRWAAGLAAGLVIAAELSATRLFALELARTGGVPTFYRGSLEASRRLLEIQRGSPDLFIADAAKLRDVLRLYTGRRLDPASWCFSPGRRLEYAEAAAILDGIARPEAVALVLLPPFDGDTIGRCGPEPFAAAGLGSQRLATIPYSDGRPWLAIERLADGPGEYLAAAAAAAAAPGRAEQAAARLEDAVNAWQRVSRALAGPSNADSTHWLSALLPKTPAEQRARRLTRLLSADPAGGARRIREIAAAAILLPREPADAAGFWLELAEADFKAANHRLAEAELKLAADQNLKFEELPWAASLCHRLGMTREADAYLDAWKIRAAPGASRRVGLPVRGSSLVPNAGPHAKPDAAYWLTVARFELQRRPPRPELEEALKHSEALAQSSELRALAILYQDLGRHDKALPLWEQILRARPWDGTLYHDRGVCRYLAGAPSDAIADFETAVRLAPAFLQGYLSLGSAYAAAGDSGEALRAYERGLRVPKRSRDEPLRRQLQESARRLRSSR